MLGCEVLLQTGNGFRLHNSSWDKPQQPQDPQRIQQVQKTDGFKAARPGLITITLQYCPTNLFEPKIKHSFFFGMISTAKQSERATPPPIKPPGKYDSMRHDCLLNPQEHMTNRLLVSRALLHTNSGLKLGGWWGSRWEWVEQTEWMICMGAIAALCINRRQVYLFSTGTFFCSSPLVASESHPSPHLNTE